MPAPAVAVVIPAKAAAATLPAALVSVLAQEADGALEVVVAVGDGLDGPTAAAARGLDDPRVRVVGNPTGGTPAGLNRAIAASTAPVVVRVDAHAVLAPGYIRRAVAVLEETGADEVGGIQDAVGTTPFSRAVAAAMRSPFAAGDAAYRRPGPARAVDTVYLGVFRRAALEAVGGYDEALARNQDYELNIRLRARGGTIWFDPDLRVRYQPRGDLCGLARQYHGYGRWKRATLRRHPGSLRWRQLAAPVVTLALAAAVVAARRTRGRTLLLPAAYAAGVAAAGLHAGRGEEPATRRRLPLVLATIHLAWGSGFLRGVRERTPHRRSRSETGPNYPLTLVVRHGKTRPVPRTSPWAVALDAVRRGARARGRTRRS